MVNSRAINSVDLLLIGVRNCNNAHFNEGIYAHFSFHFKSCTNDKE